MFDVATPARLLRLGKRLTRIRAENCIMSDQARPEGFAPFGYLPDTLRKIGTLVILLTQERDDLEVNLATLTGRFSAQMQAVENSAMPCQAFHRYLTAPGRMKSLRHLAGLERAIVEKRALIGAAVWMYVSEFENYFPGISPTEVEVYDDWSFARTIDAKKYKVEQFAKMLFSAAPAALQERLRKGLTLLHVGDSSDPQTWTFYQHRSE